MGHHPQEPLNQFDMRILESAQQGSGVPVVSGLQHERNEKDVGRKGRRERSREEEGEVERERNKCRNGHIDIINNLLMYMYNKQLCYSTMMP